MFSAKQRQPANGSGVPSSFPGSCCCCCCCRVTRLEHLKAPSWGSSLDSARLLSCLYVCSCVGPQAVVREITGTARFARLDVSTFRAPFPEDGERKEAGSEGGLQQRDGLRAHSSTCSKHVLWGNCKPSKIHRLPTS